MAEFAIQTRFDHLKLLQPAFSIVPWFQRDEEESVVTRTGKAEQTEPNDTGRRLHSRCVCQDAFDFLHDVIGTLERRSTGQLQIDVEVSLVFVWQKAGWNSIAEKSRPCSESRQHDYGDGELANERAANPDVGVGRTFKGAIEPIKKPSQ